MSNNRFMNDFSSNMSNNVNFSETKLQMAEALKRLIKDRPFSKITVQDIVIECNINRNTFYYHFENNYDLLSFTYSLEVKNIVDSFQKANASLPQAMDFVLDYIDKNIKTKVSDGIYKGIKILYRNKVYDFSLNEGNV